MKNLSQEKLLEENVEQEEPVLLESKLCGDFCKFISKERQCQLIKIIYDKNEQLLDSQRTSQLQMGRIGEKKFLLD